MPLSKKRDKARKRRERAVQPKSNLIPVQPTGSLIMEENKIIGVQPKQLKIDTVFRLTNPEAELDADGQPIPEY